MLRFVRSFGRRLFVLSFVCLCGVFVVAVRPSAVVGVVGLFVVLSLFFGLCCAMNSQALWEQVPRTLEH